MGFEDRGIRFAPVVPRNFQHLSLSGVKYRGCTLKVTISGNGTEIARFTLDGKQQAAPMLDGSLRGEHEIEIHLTGK